jgi:hypothetical protein
VPLPPIADAPTVDNRATRVDLDAIFQIVDDARLLDREKDLACVSKYAVPSIFSDDAVPHRPRDNATGELEALIHICYRLQTATVARKYRMRLVENRTFHALNGRFGRYCCKSRKSNDTKNLAKADS